MEATSITPEEPRKSEPPAAAKTEESNRPAVVAPGDGGRPRFGISAAAARYAVEKLRRRGTPEAAVRVGIKGGGCSGFSYVIEFSDEPPRQRDTVYEVDGVRFYVDKKSLIYLADAVLDYERTLMFEGFKFRNPKEASRCGCGHSFTVK